LLKRVNIRTETPEEKIIQIGVQFDKIEGRDILANGAAFAQFAKQRLFILF
jgi:hypothetical protein